MRFKYLLLLIIFILFVGGVAASIVREYVTPKDTILLPFDFAVSRNPLDVSFNLDRDKLHFGRFCMNCSAKREFTITNSHLYPEEAQIYLESTDTHLSDWLSIEPATGTVIEANSSTTFKASIHLLDAAPGNYTGTLIIKLYQVS